MSGRCSLLATHAVVYARLLIDGKDYGVHEFMVQLRDETHKPMPGVEVGDIGPKLGYNLVDNGCAAVWLSSCWLPVLVTTRGIVWLSGCLVAATRVSITCACPASTCWRSIRK